ncbi:MULTISPECIES: hypothetical protein [Bacillaceae]|uniref:Uncharacterized protein n=1 Tax=Evansella alkalicola TaxID=745819 RepID=A0ABS6JS49_9BACI|nr:MULTISPECIES: hypothetical protein [Bacillaceae]MBU9721388.1 hypothetical protein [Bacillus alkalicola]
MKKYFMHAHTSQGFHSLLSDYWKENTKVYVIKGSSDKARGKLLAEVLAFLKKENVTVEVNMHPDNGEIMESLYLPASELLLIADNSPLSLSSRLSTVTDGCINLNNCLNSTDLRKNKVKLVQLNEEMDKQRKLATACFGNGVAVHEQKEAIYLSAMDFSEADKVANEIITNWFTESIQGEENPKTSRHFFGAGTSYGPINFIDSITEDLDHRLIIKGRSGSGKSTLMRKIGWEAEKRFLSVDYYPCALDPDSIDMVVIPALNKAILDGTAPHVIDATREGDEIVDMYERCIDPSIEEKYSDRLEEISRQYKEIMKKGTQHLQRADEIGELVHKIYSDATVEEEYKNVVDETIRLVKKYI